MYFSAKYHQRLISWIIKNLKFLTKINVQSKVLGTYSLLKITSLKY